MLGKGGGIGRGESHIKKVIHTGLLFIACLRDSLTDWYNFAPSIAYYAACWLPYPRHLARC